MATRAGAADHKLCYDGDALLGAQLMGKKECALKVNSLPCDRPRYAGRELVC